MKGFRLDSKNHQSTSPDLNLEKPIYEPRILEVRESSSEDFEDGMEYEVVYKTMPFVLHLHHSDEENSPNFKYYLFLNIRGMTYKIYLARSGGGFGYGFKTEEYGFAWTKLNDEEKDKLFKGVADFFETVNNDNNEVRTIHSSPSIAQESAEDVERCLHEIIACLEDLKKNNTQKYEEILSDYYWIKMIMGEELDDYSPEINDWKNYVLKNGVSGIFGAYPKIVGREFQRSNVKTNDSAAAKRYFFFQRTWPKYLKNWKLEDDKANGIYSYKFVRK